MDNFRQRKQKKFQAAKGNVVSEFIALRPARNNGLRLESTKIEYDQVRDATDESLKKEALVNINLLVNYLWP